MRRPGAIRRFVLGFPQTIIICCAECPARTIPPHRKVRDGGGAPSMLGHPLKVSEIGETSFVRQVRYVGSRHTTGTTLLTSTLLNTVISSTELE
jgi:hypothetical protein